MYCRYLPAFRIPRASKFAGDNSYLKHYSALSCPAERNAFVIALIGELLVARCAPNGKRTLSIIDAANIPRIDDARKIEMLSIFADGYFRAQEELRRTPQKDAEESGDKRDPHKSRIFGQSLIETTSRE